MRTILVVDDRPDTRYATTRVLAGGRLADVDGFEVCRRLKGDAATRAIPVIQKTSVYKDPDHRRQGLAAGAEAYLIEPVEPDVLIETVRRFLSDR